MAEGQGQLLTRSGALIALAWGADTLRAMVELQALAPGGVDINRSLVAAWPRIVLRFIRQATAYEWRTVPSYEIQILVSDRAADYTRLWDIEPLIRAALDDKHSVWADGGYIVTSRIRTAEPRDYVDPDTGEQSAMLDITWYVTVNPVPYDPSQP